MDVSLFSISGSGHSGLPLNIQQIPVIFCVKRETITGMRWGSIVRGEESYETVDGLESLNHPRGSMDKDLMECLGI